MLLEEPSKFRLPLAPNNLILLWHLFCQRTSKRTGTQSRACSFWRHHPHIESCSARPSGAAESGSHSPLGDRQARLPGVECANIRQRRNSGIRLQCILIKKMPIGSFGQGSRSEPFPVLFRRAYT